jgi:hypothetical protein
MTTYPQQKEVPQIQLRSSLWSIFWYLDGNVNVGFRSISKDRVKIAVVEHRTDGLGWVNAILGIVWAGGKAKDDSSLRGDYDVALGVLR